MLFVLLLLPIWGQSQISMERFAQRAVQKEKWEHAHSQLKKLMRKDSLNVAAQYVMASYFFAPHNPSYQLDSAYRFTLLATLHYFQTSARQRERLARFPIDSLILLHLKEDIDSAAFERARKINSEAGYVAFLANFPFAKQTPQATELRNEVAYLDVLRENTYQAFNDYFLKYPTAANAPEARIHYERLLYDTKTKDRSLISYQSFLEEFPQSSYRNDAEKNIFEISTALGTVESYRDFLQVYPESEQVKKANAILFYLLPRMEELDAQFSSNDSLMQVARLVGHYVVPVLHNGLIVFMNEKGEEVTSPQASELLEDYRCGDITDDVLILSDKIISRTGSIIFLGKVDAVTDLGAGFLKIETDSCTRIIHKSGFSIGDTCITDAKIISGKMLAIQKGNMWSLWTFSGKMLIPFLWDDIATIDNVVIFEKENKYKLATLHSISLIANQQPLPKLDSFDEVKVWPQGHVWVQSGEYQGVLNQQLDVFIRFEKHELSSAFFGALAASSSAFYLFNKHGDESPAFKRMETSKPWVAVKTNLLSWRLMNAEDFTFQSPAFDTIRYAGPFAIGHHADSMTLYFNPYYTLDFPQSVKLEFIPGKDSTSFLMAEQNEMKVVYDGEGKKLFNASCDRIQYAGDGFFIITKKGKKGLMTSEGKLMLPLEYDAIGSVQNGVVSLLKAFKFGVYAFAKTKMIKPEYTKNITLYTKNIVVAYKEGHYGFMGWDSKPLSKFEFEEVKYWNDTTALVKSNFRWRLYTIRTGKTEMDKIRDYVFVRDSDEEKIAIVHQENTYGVIHNRKGEIIPSHFSDIVNIGSREVPLYFTEKHVEEASIFVVIYYDYKGMMLRKEVYEQDEYEKIYCADK